MIDSMFCAPFSSNFALECHLLALIIRALDRHPPDRPVLSDQDCLPSAPKNGQRKTHIVEIGCLPKVRLIECRHYFELCARHVESPVHFDTREARLAAEVCIYEARWILESGALEMCGA